MKMKIQTLCIVASCALLPVSVFADIASPSGVALSSGTEVGNASLGVFEVSVASAIPEPSSYAALAGFVVLALALAGRRRSNH